MRIEDFDLLQVIGKGSFGKVRTLPPGACAPAERDPNRCENHADVSRVPQVMLVRKKDTRQVFAMKVAERESAAAVLTRR